MRPGWGALFVYIALSLGCAAKQSTPEAALREYLAAVKAKDPKKSYALLSQSLQQRFGSEEEFAAFFATYYPEILAEAERLSAATKPQIEATLPLENGAQALLYQSPQGWVVYQERALPAAKSVDEALNALAQLARSAANDGPLGFYLSAEAKEERKLRLLAFAALLDLVSPLDLSITERHATVTLKDGRSLRFFLEGDHWTLVSLPEELLF